MISLRDLPTAAIYVTVFVVVMVVGALILQDIKDDQTTDSSSFNVSVDGLDALENMSEQTDTLTTVIIFGAIIGILFGVFYGFVSRG